MPIDEKNKLEEKARLAENLEKVEERKIAREQRVAAYKKIIAEREKEAKRHQEAGGIKNKPQPVKQKVEKKDSPDVLAWKDDVLGNLSDIFPANFEEVTTTSLVLREPKPVMKTTDEMWESLSPVRVQGGSVRTCSLSEGVERVEVLMKTDGRPLHANVDVWQGPDNIPQKMVIFCEDGMTRPFRAIIECLGGSSSIGIRNTGTVELPLHAAAETDFSTKETSINPSHVFREGKPTLVQGSAVFSKSFDSSVESVQVKLESKGRPLNARVELLHGPGNTKQVIEIYSEDGRLRPFYAIFETPGAGNVVRIVNTGTIEFPFDARVESYIENEGGKKSLDAGCGVIRWT